MEAPMIAEQAPASAARRRTSRWAKVALAVGAVGLVAGCAGFRIERQGKDVGKEICDLKNAANAQDAQKDVAKINNDLQDAQRITGVSVNQDVQAANEQISDLQKHVPNGNSALAQQDISVLQRNVEQAIKQTSGHVQRFYQGLAEGLSDCESS